MTAVFVHGNPETAAIWGPLFDALGRDDVIALSPPGFGAPVPGGFGATADDYGHWLADELVAIGEPVDLVGHDWGGGHVVRIAMDHPDLIRSWTTDIMGAFDEDYVWHDMAQMWQTPEVGEQIMEAMNGEMFVDALAPMVGHDVAVEMESHITDEMKSCILALYRSAVNVGEEWADPIDTITTPGLVLWGADDPYVTPEFGERLAERTGARLVMFDDSGHWWPVTKPVEVAQQLTTLWSGVVS